MTVLGSNFGTNGSICVESYRAPTEQEIIKIDNDNEYAEGFTYDPMLIQERFKLDQQSPREDNRIILKVDNTEDKLKVRSYIVRVEKMDY